MFENAPPSAGEVRALANQLLSWANFLSARPMIGREPTREEQLELVLGMAVAARESGRLREKIMPGVELGNPAWQIILELFIQSAGGYRIERERLPLVAYLPSDVVAQTLDRLERAGLVETVSDRAVPAKHWLALSETGERKMIDLLLKSAELVWPFAAEDVGAANPLSA
jgi:hypothetical protein